MVPRLLFDSDPLPENQEKGVGNSTIFAICAGSTCKGDVHNNMPPLNCTDSKQRAFDSRLGRFCLSDQESAMRFDVLRDQLKKSIRIGQANVSQEQNLGFFIGTNSNLTFDAADPAFFRADEGTTVEIEGGKIGIAGLNYKVNWITATPVDSSRSELLCQQSAAK